MADDVPLLTLIVQETKATIFRKLLEVADALGLDVETWRIGDPTRTTFEVLASRLAERDADTPAIIKGAFLGLAAGGWLTELGKRNYDTPRREATYARCTLELTNTTALNIGTINPETLSPYNSATGARFRNETGGTLGPGPGSTLRVTIVAREKGSASTSGVGDVDTLETPIPGVTVSNISAAAAYDDEEDDPYTERCQGAFASRSPGGPKKAIETVALKPELYVELFGEGTTFETTRVLVLDDDDRGYTAVFLAGASGAVAPAEVTKTEDVIETYANPFTRPIDVFTSTNKTIAATYELWVYDTINLSTTEIEDLVETSLIAALKTRPIGGDDRADGVPGKIYQGWIEARILEAVSPHGYRCVVSVPSGDTSLTVTYDRDSGTGTAEVAVLGAVTPTVNIIERKGG